MQPLDLRQLIRDVPDFPKPGIVFKDITPLLRSARAFQQSTDELAQAFHRERISHVAAMESRGFIFGSCVAQKLEAGFIPIRKPGKLPWTKRSHEYQLEYGTDKLEIHDDALAEGDRVLIVDDVLATGGTAAAAIHLVRGFAAHIAGLAIIIELDFLKGREKIEPVKVHSLIHY